MILTTWRNLFLAREGREVETTTAAFMARILSPKSYRFENEWPRYALASFRDGHRCLDAFRFAHAIELDLDRGASREWIEATFGVLCGFAHTTKRSTPDLQRWRVGIHVDRSVDGDEFPRVWRAVAELAERGGLEPDYAARDASRCWAAPSNGPHYKAFELRGALFDVGAALDRFPPPSPLPEPAKREPSNDLASRIERARRYVDKMDAAIAGANGHTQTFRVACVLVRGFSLPPDVALEILSEYNGRCSPAWSVPELRHKVQSAAQRSTRTHGWLVDRPIERRSA
jgi:hypothetical protein